MKIDRHNYEEYFILYLDNELSAAERSEVETFSKLHPDLQEELDILLQSKLLPDQHIVFEGKEELLSFGNNLSISLSNYEEWLVLYIDNELTATERSTVEQFAATHPAVLNDLHLLMQTKSEPESIIVFAGKETLYRREEKTRPVFWWRVAAAAAVLVAIVTTLIFTLNKNKEPQDLASGQSKTTAPVQQVVPVKPVDLQQEPTPETAIATIDQSTTVQPGKQDDKVVKLVKANNEKANDRIAVVIPVPEKQQQQQMIASTDNLPGKQTPGNTLVSGNTDRTVVNQAGNTTSDQKLYANNNTTDNNNSAQQQKSNKSAVTDQFTDTYTKVDGSANKDDNKAVVYASENSNKKGGLRGFFRKVTRTFEKKTNIEATDDDDRLLVGGLAIRL